MVVQNNKQNLNKFWLKFFVRDMILYQYHFFDKDIRYDIISNFWPRYRYDIISSKKRYFQCLVVTPSANRDFLQCWPNDKLSRYDTIILLWSCKNYATHIHSRWSPKFGYFNGRPQRSGILYENDKCICICI
jgi:hypothetical protein